MESLPNYRLLTEGVFVGGQVLESDMAELATQGVQTIINNRPEGEMYNQPSSEVLEKAAKAAGLNYVYLPMIGGLTLDLVEGSEAAYKDLPLPAIAFCASGMRSVVLWCFAFVKDKGVDSVLDTAAKAGFELSHIRSGLETYAQK